jgi:Ca2+-transporting ATPase
MLVSQASGLSEAEARRRLAATGPNELPRSRNRTVVRIAIETLREPMLMLLAGAAILYLTLGDVGEGLFLTAGATLSIALVVLQEARSERALKALRALAEPQVRVLRDGIVRTLASRELVPGDVLLVSEGERLHADGRLVAGDLLSVDESALTGESAPVTKRHAQDDEAFDETSLGRDAALGLFAGTLVVRGQGMVEVARTGAATALGRIGASLAALPEPPTPLQRTTRRLVAVLGVAAIGFCGAIALAYGVLRGDWVGGALAGVTAAMSLVPEEFPMVLTVFMALGAWRLATHKVLVRRGAVIETLGGASILCVDKTGTLTQNRMELIHLWTAEGRDPDGAALVDAASARLLEVARLACPPRSTDPMDLAVLRRFGDRVAVAAPAEAPQRTWPLRPDRLAVVQFWPGERGVLAAKGAPEAVLGLCRLAEVEAAPVRRQVQAYAEAGLRVLAAAEARVEGAAPAEPEAIVFTFAGLLAFEDPLRPEVPAALAEARRAGLGVLMITGDHPATALAIARQAGIDVSAGVLLGAEAAALPFPTLCERLRTVRVLARVSPDQKLLIVEALKADGEVVAMTGDGVNDAPALEAAHIGIAMGLRGTDVAREAADLVLLDDSFASIVGGVRLGRRIFANLRRAMTYVAAIHVPVAGLALGPVLLGLPPLLWPMHVMLLELAIDPTCALVFENEPSERDAMNRPPRDPEEGLFAMREVAFAALQGTVMLAAVFGLYIWALSHETEAAARGMTYLALIVATLALALTDSMSPDGGLFARHRWPIALISAAAALALALVLTVPPLEAIFKLTTPTPVQLGLGLLIGVVSGGWFGAVRVFGARRRRVQQC